MVAIAPLELVHVPPAVKSVSVIDVPGHTLLLLVPVPLMSAGNALTVILVTATHPVDSIYDTVAVPTDRPVITPVADGPLTTVDAGAAHVPPLVGLLSETDEPTHNVELPTIALAAGLAVATIVAKQPAVVE